MSENTVKCVQSTQFHPWDMLKSGKWIATSSISSIYMQITPIPFTSPGYVYAGIEVFCIQEPDIGSLSLLENMSKNTTLFRTTNLVATVRCVVTPLCALNCH